MHTLYILLHVLCLLASLGVLYKLLYARPSKALVITILLTASGAMYIFGFVLEIFTDSLDIAYTGTILEYFGECLVFLSFLRFMTLMCKRTLPDWIYVVAGIFSLAIIYLLMTTRENHIFYKSIGMDTSGSFPRLSLEYGPGFFLFVIYMALVCGSSIVMGLYSIQRVRGIERRRILLVLLGIFCPWSAFLAKLIGITGGYEISAVGVFGSLFLVYRALVSYGYFDSVQLAGENALHHFGDGVLVVDTNKNVLYSNVKMHELFPELSENSIIKNQITEHPLLCGTMTAFKKDGRTYEIDMIPLEEQGYVQGYMYTTKDMTDHYRHLEETERFAHTDALTGLYNRAYFIELFDAFRKNGGFGTMLMFDLDNFKGVNDTYGHGLGDKVLITLAETIQNASKKYHLSCRIGGDEFCMFLKDIVDKETVGNICDEMIKDFPERLEAAEIGKITSISIGAAILNTDCLEDNGEDFKNIYKEADNALYIAKNSGKGIFKIHNA